ncbi:hypothetical protein IV203_002755 [Nitzschia inconspicua]|uniref:Protein kinase domain-containing protein n=1 Tax=Nitzschia inconspicua TaxID=303405 RepID=A0A9K3L263_9STRA|nr:hypothetical protein IV203_002755 [Nitzschia inconspicua]
MSNNEDFYKYFDKASNEGRVFDTDLSLLEELPVNALTEIEQLEREAWRNKQKVVQEHYLELDAPKVTSSEMMLQQRVMTPHLKSVCVSSRSLLKEARRGRRYPAKIEPWTFFGHHVTSFRPPHQALNEKVHIFDASSDLTNYEVSLSDEREEEAFILQVLRKALVKTKITGEITTRGGIGRPDAMVLKTTLEDGLPKSEDIGLIAEFKSTHNLPLPMTAEGVANSYNRAYNEVMIERGGRSPLWARVCHPIGQLLGYMVENGRRYGALASATRAYFVTIQGSGSDARVGISDPFFVGQHNFLRAWACIQSLACEQSEPLVAKQLTWNKTSKNDPTPPPKSRRPGSLRSSAIITESNEDDDMGTTGGPQTSSATGNLGLTEVSIDDVEILESLGYGHNGVVYLAKWGGRKVALKQFDVGKDGYEYFDKELAAYVALKDAWGTLVTTPLFVSESWSGWIKFIGLQLGRDPRPGDDLSDWEKVLTSLETQYGFRHDDAEGRNMVFVTDKTTGAERLVAMDLEAHTMRL